MTFAQLCKPDFLLNRAFLWGRFSIHTFTICLHGCDTQKVGKKGWVRQRKRVELQEKNKGLLCLTHLSDGALQKCLPDSQPQIQRGSSGFSSTYCEFQNV